jgi:hypothetical protein
VTPGPKGKFHREASDRAPRRDRNSLMNVAPAPSRGDPAKSFGIGSGADGSACVEKRK